MTLTPLESDCLARLGVSARAIETHNQKYAAKTAGPEGKTMTTERTDHVAKAKALLTRNAQFTDPDLAEISADCAGLTHATLALVEQQRIANLIALGQFRVGAEDLPHLRHLVIRPKNEYDIDSVPDIAAALGIEEVPHAV